MIAGAEHILISRVGSDIGDGITVRVKSPSADNFIELDNTITTPVYSEYGYYNLLIPSTYLMELGTYVFKVEAPLASFEEFIVMEALPAPLYAETLVDTCIVTGNIRDLTGSMEQYGNIVITAQPLKLPLKTQTSFVLGTKVHTYADFAGNFTLPLLKGMTVILEIKDAAVRFQVEIPDLPTVNIIDLMPTV